MLRNGSGGARQAGEAVAADAECGAFVTGGNRVPADVSVEPLSLCRLSAGALAGLGREGLLAVLGDIERLVNQAVGYRAEVLGALDA